MNSEIDKQAYYSSTIIITIYFRLQVPTILLLHRDKERDQKQEEYVPSGDAAATADSQVDQGLQCRGQVWPWPPDAGVQQEHAGLWPPHVGRTEQIEPGAAHEEALHRGGRHGGGNIDLI